MTTEEETERLRLFGFVRAGGLADRPYEMIIIMTKRETQQHHNK